MPSPCFGKELPARQREGRSRVPGSRLFPGDGFIKIEHHARGSGPAGKLCRVQLSVDFRFPHTNQVARLGGFGAVSSDTEGREIDDYLFSRLPKGLARWRAET